MAIGLRKMGARRQKLSECIRGGLADGRFDREFDQGQLRRGVEVESEHTDDPQIAREIAKDHLTEHPRYYTALKEMEKRLKSQEKHSSVDSKGRLVWITGRGGAGKSTMARKLAPEFDLMVGSDTGHPHPETGVWQEPTPEEKIRIRRERADQMIKAREEGKSILFEGAPGPVSKYPEDLFGAIDEIRALKVPKRVLRQNVIARSKERGSWDDPVARADDMANFEALYNNYDESLAKIRQHTKAPVQHIVPDYLMKKSSIHAYLLKLAEESEQEEEHESEGSTLSEAIRRRAEAIVLDPDTGHMLAIRERDDIFPDRVKLELPGGGVDEDEEGDEAAIRETAEEAGEAIRILRQIPTARPTVLYGEEQLRKVEEDGGEHVGEETDFYAATLSMDTAARVLARHLHQEENEEAEEESEEGEKEEDPEEEGGIPHEHERVWLPVQAVVQALQERLEQTAQSDHGAPHVEQDQARIQAIVEAAEDMGIKVSSLAQVSMLDELMKISASLSETAPTLQRGPLDTLDRRTIRAHRKPNVRFISTTTQSGKIVK